MLQEHNMGEHQFITSTLQKYTTFTNILTYGMLRFTGNIGDKTSSSRNVYLRAANNETQLRDKIFSILTLFCNFLA